MDMNKGMRAVQILCILSIAFLVLVASDVMAADFSCGSYIIAIGDRSYDILRKCGDPSNVISWEEVRARKEIWSWTLEPEKRFYYGPLFAKELVTIEEWEYNQGPNRFIRYLKFENGRLTRVTTGEYGY